MNIIEATSFFVRVTCFDFKNRDQQVKLQFRIIPMIHIGSKAYYEQALNSLKECDEIIYEGVISHQTDFITSQHLSIAKQVNLVTQNDYLKLDSLSKKLIHADYTKETSKKAWKTLRFKEKLKWHVLFPLQLLYDSFTLTRKKLAKGFMHSREELYLAFGPRPDEPGTISNYVMNTREQIIFKTIDDKMELDSDKEKLIGILYGAGHMNTICRYLIDRLNYVPHNGKFLKVFTI